MVLINETSEIGSILIGMTLNFTGSIFLSLLLLMIFLFSICLVFRMPLEFSAVLMLPFIYVSLLVTSQFMAVLGIVLIYGSVIFINRFFLSR